MSIHSILRGKGNNLDWNSPPPQEQQRVKIRRRYKDTLQGSEAWENSNLQFPGLLNAAGNLCFLNATLQSMASLPSLLIYLDSLLSLSESITTTTTSVSLPVTSSLYTILTALNEPSTRPLKPLLLATALADSSESRKKLLKSSEQQDAHELWGMIRDAIEEESEILFNSLIKGGADGGDDEEEVQMNGGGLKEVLELSKNGFKKGIEGIGGGGSKKRTTRTRRRKRENDPWFWLRSQRIKCMNCGYVRDTRHEGEELLMLNVPPVSTCSLYDLLGEYTKPDLLSDYACRKCSMLTTLSKYKTQRDRLTSGGEMTISRKERLKKLNKLVEKIESVVNSGDFERLLENEGGGTTIKVEKVGTAAGKLVNLARTPEILLIHLNRSTHFGYSGGPIKNSCQVTFPEYLDLSPFCDHPTTTTTTTTTTSSNNNNIRDLYKLKSMVVHYGSHHFGHYVAFRRTPIQQPLSRNIPEWYRISDETVEISNLNQVLNNNPFLLFYERVKQPPPQPEEEEKGEGEGEGGGEERIKGISLLKETERLRPRVVESWSVRTPPINETEQKGGET
ncbi:hypothetical protein JCM3765_006114 [Sporobolomyces pararoseus]